MAGATHGGEVTLHLSADPTNTGAASLYRADQGAVRRSVPMVRLDRLLEERGWDFVDALKIDVEGAEAEVLDGMAGIFARRPPRLLVVELTGGLGSDAPLRAWQALRRHGYETYRIAPGGETRETFGERDAAALNAIVNIACVPGGVR